MQCPIWLFSVVPRLRVFPVYCPGTAPNDFEVVPAEICVPLGNSRLFEFLTNEEGTAMLSRNVGKELTA